MILTDALQQSLIEIRNNMIEKQDTKHCEKIQQLLDKLDSGQFYVTLCGHFSAGKSSLINHLCGHPLLPSSPIPTSANVVSIRHGESQAIVKKRSDRRQYAIPLDELEAYCVNGNEIESVEIQHPIPLLQDHITLLDTPGIDSTDEAHMLSTESALHLADVVLYVMDYNHVLSEINFHFIKYLQEQWGKPLYLIVNQIDKHKNEELPFDQFRQNIKKAFADWRISPDGFLFISVKHSDHPYNELPQLKTLIHKLNEISAELKQWNVQHAVKQLIHEHVQWITDQHQMQPPENAEQLEQQMMDLQSRISKLEDRANEVEMALKKEIRGLLEDAIIMPAWTRDLAHQFLQSCKPGFKTGLFFAAQKTEEERKQRLLRFHHDLMEKVKAHIEIHLKELLRKNVDPMADDAENLLQSIADLTIQVEPEWLRERVKQDSLYSDEYTMNYCMTIAAELKEMARKMAFDRLESIVVQIRRSAEQTVKQLKQEMVPLMEPYQAVLKWKQFQQDMQSMEAELNELISWEQTAITLPETQQIDIEPSIELHQEQKTRQETAPHQPLSHRPMATLSHPYSHEKLKGKLIHSADKLLRACQLIEDLPGMSLIVKSMKEKSARLQNSEFTIALFGAFSAGKSSFANALLGENVLPVSPNPTTAAINKVTAPKDPAEHGMAKVVMKSRETLLAEIQASLAHLGHHCDDLEQAMQIIRTLEAEQISGKDKVHYTFLRAFEAGWEFAKHRLGQELFVDSAEYPSYAAEETKSCFVEVIELYYACPLTEAGFILVDTPGADSIHARHTDVAFDYIKNADLILFVTYYNHAFSQADREFLLQLGRVKDSFELDKMFFIINAIDLASSDEERAQVIEHVQANLLQHEIRHPRIHAISSVMALEGKKTGDEQKLQSSGITDFEQNFIRFTSEELLDLSVQSAEKDIARAAHIVEKRLRGAEASKEKRSEQLAALQQQYQASKVHLDNIDFAEEQRVIAEEITELLYYVKQRVFLRYHELYQLAFNPSAFQSDKQDLRTALNNAWKELYQSIVHHCSQEILATTLRIEKLVNTRARERYEQMNEHIKQQIDMFEPEAYESTSFETPDMWIDFPPVDVQEKWLMGQFKNAKTFFEGDGRDRLKKQIEDKLVAPVGIYIDQYDEWFRQYYLEQSKKWFNELTIRMRQSLQETVEGYAASLQSDQHLDDLRSRDAQLKDILARE